MDLSEVATPVLLVELERRTLQHEATGLRGPMPDMALDGAAGTSRPQPEVWYELELAEDAAGRLEELVEQLVARLGPVRATRVDDAVASDFDARTSLGGRIGNLGRRVDAAASRVLGAITELEL